MNHESPRPPVGARLCRAIRRQHGHAGDRPAQPGSYLWITFLACFLAACAVPPVHERPALAVPAQFSPDGVRWLASKGDITPVGADWWKAFGDPELDRLQARVALDNQTLKQAEAAYRIARAALDSASAERLPGVSASASSSRARSAGAVSGSHALGVSATWEIDLWDRVRLGISAAEAGAEASAADLAAARLSIQASLAQTWLAWRAAGTQIRLLQDTLAAQERFLALTRNRLQGGVASPLDVAQAETQVHTARAQISAAELERAQLHHALAALLGGEFQTPEIKGLGLLPAPPALLPSALLQRRPDIAAAERRVAAANARLGVAQTAWFPSLELGASAGVKSARLSNLLELPGRVWSLGPTLALTLFDAGAREAARESARASRDQAAAGYRQTVLTAFQEVEDALAAARLLEQEATAQEDALSTARRARTIAEERYRAGMASALEVISARTSELAAARSVTTLWSRRAGAAVTLLKNAGGDIVPLHP
ncbi:MAG: efflux transporter outer membrane subunit [Betaproteobacteria bacterium]|nr:efflux transporter outer membrane subunit [Betaproteobacteria bacterium]